MSKLQAFETLHEGAIIKGSDALVVDINSLKTEQGEPDSLVDFKDGVIETVTSIGSEELEAEFPTVDCVFDGGILLQNDRRELFRLDVSADALEDDKGQTSFCSFAFD